jgi:AraC-like DNA-binding protein
MDPLSTLFDRFSFNARLVLRNSPGPNPGPSRGPIDASHAHGAMAAVGCTLYVIDEGEVVFSGPDTPPLQVTGPALVLYPHGMRQRMQAVGAAVVTCAAILFEDSEGAAGHPLLLALPERVHISLTGMAPLSHTLALLFAEAGPPSFGQDAILGRMCDVLLIQVIRHEFQQARVEGGVLAGLADRQLGPVLGAMHARPDASWQLQALAALACMSRAAFSERFRTVVGMAPMEYLTRWRMGLACRLLREGMPVKVVCGQAGYRSPPAFTRAFTEHVGVSPRAWLREFAHG